MKTDWLKLHADLCTEQGRAEKGPLLSVARGCFQILFIAVLLLVDDKVREMRRE